MAQAASNGAQAQPGCRPGRTRRLVPDNRPVRLQGTLHEGLDDSGARVGGGREGPVGLADFGREGIPREGQFRKVDGTLALEHGGTDSRQYKPAGRKTLA